MSNKTHYIDERAENMLEHLRRQPDWVYSKSLEARFGLSGEQVRQISADTGVMVSSRDGYKHILNASEEEFNEYIGSMHRRIKGLESHIAKSLKAWGDM